MHVGSKLNLNSVSISGLLRLPYQRHRLFQTSLRVRRRQGAKHHHHQSVNPRHPRIDQLNNLLSIFSIF